MSSHALRWLHISDLHAGAPGDASRWPRAKSTVLNYLGQQEPFDFVLLTGDVAFQGIAEDYERFDETMEQLAAVLGHGVPWFVVPGNHDLCRPGKSDLVTMLTNTDYTGYRASIKARDPYSRNLFSGLFEQYTAWFSRSIVPTWTARGFSVSPGFFPGDYVISAQFRGIKVGIAGMNSAFLHVGDAHGERTLAVEQEQLLAGEPNLDDWAARHHMCLLLMHHPPVWLTGISEDELMRWLSPPGRFAAMHVGHAHHPRNTAQRTSPGYPERVVVQASSLLGLEHFGTSREVRSMGFVEAYLTASSITSGVLRVDHRLVVDQTSGAMAVRPDPRQDPEDYHVRFHQPYSPLSPAALLSASKTVPAPAVTPLGRELPIADGAASPPRVTGWVGREAELAHLRNPHYSVVAISGIAGQGKSYLAAHALELAGSDGYVTDWRNCKEEGDRLHTVLANQVCRFSAGKIFPPDIAGCTLAELSAMLFQHIGSRPVCLVYDNVDSYLAAEQGEPVPALRQLLANALESAGNVRLIMTCRPNVNVDHPAFLNLRLVGLSPAEGLQLFEALGADTSAPETRDLIAQAVKLTQGHAKWLSLLVGHFMTKSRDAVRKIISAGLANPEIPLPQAVLEPIWQSLSDVDKGVMRPLAMALRPHTLQEIARLWHKAPKVDRAREMKQARESIGRLMRNQLVSEYVDQLGVVRYELHPLVRGFVQKKTPPKERSQVISIIIERFYDAVIRPDGVAPAAVVIGGSSQAYDLVLERIELLLTRGDHRAAVKALAGCSHDLKEAGCAESFIRVAMGVVREIDLNEAVAEEFDGVHELVRHLAKACVEMGHRDRAMELLNTYEMALGTATVAFVGLCEARSYVFWFIGDYQAAIQWADRGQALVATGGLDTDVDCSHNRALALRDSGQPALALPIFLQNAGLVDLDDLGKRYKNEDQEVRTNGPLLGNIGRCLEFVGDNDLAGCDSYPGRYVTTNAVEC